MAGADGQKTDALIARLTEKPFAFDFYAALRRLQSCFPEQPRFGYSATPRRDPVRFAQRPGLAFAPATIESVQLRAPGHAPVFYSRHFGLFGPNGPLPLCYTEFAHDRILHFGDSTLVDFCNVFHHRLVSFFFRSWADAHKTVDSDRAQDQHWSQFLASLIGLGMESLRERGRVPDRAKFYFAGRLVHQTRNAEGLEAIIQDFFGIPTEVLTFFGRWLELPPGSTCKLGTSPETGTLGVTIIAGVKFWTCQLHFRLRLGPMRLADLERMLPTGGSYHRLCDWVRLYAGEHYSWDVQLVLAKDEVPPIRLGTAGRLGWTTWLKTKPFDQDAGDLVLQGPA